MEQVLSLAELAKKLESKDDLVSSGIAFPLNTVRDQQSFNTIFAEREAGLFKVLSDMDSWEVFEVFDKDRNPLLRIRVDNNEEGERTMFFYRHGRVTVSSSPLNKSSFGLFILQHFIDEHVDEPNFRTVMLNSTAAKNSLNENLTSALQSGDIRSANILLSRKVPSGTTVMVRCGKAVYMQLNLGYDQATLVSTTGQQTRSGVDAQKLIGEMTMISAGFARDRMPCAVEVSMPE